MSAPEHRRGTTRGLGGFTLIEAMVAVGVLAFGLLTLAVMQLEALSQGSAGRHTADAAAVARSYLEQVQRVPWAELDQTVGLGWTTDFWTGTGATVDVSVDTPAAGGAAVEHSYAVDWQVTAVNPCLFDVEVRATWNEEDNALPKTLRLASRRYNWANATSQGNADPGC